MAANLEVNTEWLALLARADVLGRTAHDKADLLHRVESFAAFCKAHGCWGKAQPPTENRTVPPPADRWGKAQPPTENRTTPPHRLAEMPGTAPQQQNENLPAGTTVVVMSGLSATGRNAYISENLQGMPVISPDEDSLAKEKAKEFLQEKQSFAWNAPNITRQLRNPLVRFFTANKAAVTIVYVEVPYAELAPSAGLDKQVRRLEVPVRAEAPTVMYHIRNDSP